MSSSHEPSYYEIALTNRQVVVAFVILLACLLTAFFSGVWVGRGGAERNAEPVVRATPPPDQQAEGTSLEELEFFDRRDGKHPQQPARDERATTLAEDLDARAGSPAPTPTPAPARQAAATPPPAPVPTPAPAPPRVAAVPTPAPATPTPRPAAPAADRRAAASEAADREPGAGSVVIQVFATPEREEAARVRNRLRSGGQPAFLSPLSVDGRTMFRVRIGPFASRDEAQKVAETVRKTYRLDTWVTQ